MENTFTAYFYQTSLRHIAAKVTFSAQLIGVVLATVKSDEFIIVYILLQNVKPSIIDNLGLVT